MLGGLRIYFLEKLLRELDFDGANEELELRELGAVHRVVELLAVVDVVVDVFEGDVFLEALLVDDFCELPFVLVNEALLAHPVVAVVEDLLLAVRRREVLLHFFP